MKKIDTNTMKNYQKNKKDVKIINVLSKDSFEKEHIPGSKNAPLDENFIESVKRIAPNKNEELIVHCQNTSCPASKKAAERLEKEGFKNVLCYEGGIDEWRNSGQKLENKEKVGSPKK